MIANSLVRRALRRFAGAASPVLNKLGVLPALDRLETLCAFATGRGSGSGWDMVNEVATIASFLPRQPITIFDIGANNGTWSLLLAQRLGRQENSFFLFECAPYCFEDLEKRVLGIPNCKVIKVAVSDKNGQSMLHIPRVGSGLASMHMREDTSVMKHDYTTTKVQTQTLDTIASKLEIDRINLLKMDIEGHELFALSGAKKLLARNSIDVVTFEFGSANVNSRTFFRDIWKLLKSYDFAIHRIIPGGGTIIINKYSDNLEYFRGATNYIAVKYNP